MSSTKNRMTTLKLIHFGDSLTECPQIAEEKRWTSLVSSRLRASLGNGGTLISLNRGVSGRNTRQALEDMQKDVQFERPDVLTIQFGANDSVYWKSNEGVPIVSELAFRANLIEMAERARRFGVKKLFFVTTHRLLKDNQEINGRTSNQNLEVYNQITRRAAQETQAELIDLYQELLPMKPADYVLPMPDGVHLNERGCTHYSTIFSPRLEKSMKELLEIPC